MSLEKELFPDTRAGSARWKAHSSRGQWMGGEGSSDGKRTLLSLAVPADPLDPFPPEVWRQELFAQSLKGIDFFLIRFLCVPTTSSSRSVLCCQGAHYLSKVPLGPELGAASP